MGRCRIRTSESALAVDAWAQRGVHPNPYPGRRPGFQFPVVEGAFDEDLLAGPDRCIALRCRGSRRCRRGRSHVGTGTLFNDLGNLEVRDAVAQESSLSGPSVERRPLRLRLTPAESKLPGA